MDENKEQNIPSEHISFLALGGEEDVTRNMYLYEYKDQVLIVDCGLGFPDETMLGVDLLLPDISYLLNSGKRIVGMVLTHGHEDHIGGLPFILPQLSGGQKAPPFPIYGSPLTTSFANEKLSEFNLTPCIKMVNFTDPEIRLGDFTISFIRVTHSVPDAANIFIKTPVGNFFHGSDFKFDFTPADGNRTEFQKIAKAASEGVLCLMSDCLGSEKAGFSRSEEALSLSFEREMRECKGKFFITTYSSNISRLNQGIMAAEKLNRKVCFVGRSIIKAKQIGQSLGYLKIKAGTEIPLQDIKNFRPEQLVLMVAGSQGQENSAMTRIAEGEHKEVKLSPSDVVVFSADTIPGNEVAVNSLIDTIGKKGAKVFYSEISDEFHVSGHGSSGDHMLLISLAQPKYLVPISGTYRHMISYRDIAQKMGYKRGEIFLVENGQRMLFFKDQPARFGKKIDIKNVYVDEVSGEELENYVIRDREKLAKEGIVIVMAEVKASDGQLVGKPDIITRGSSMTDAQDLPDSMMREIGKELSQRKGRITNWVHTRRLVGKISERHIYRRFHTRPLVIPMVIEV